MKGNNIKRSFIREILESITPEMISLAGGLPDPSLFPLDAIRESSAKALSSPHTLQYTVTSGISQLRELIAELYTDTFSFPTGADEILITSGSQQALDLLAKTHLKKGVWVHEPIYLGAVGSFRINHIPIHSLGNMPDIVSCLDNTLPQKSTCYLISDYQNPGTHTFSDEERKHCAAILEERESLLIEDGAYSLLGFEGIHTPIAREIPKRSIHMGSFSKILAPGLRIGWLRMDRSLLSPLLAAKEASDLHSNTLSQYLITEYWQTYGIFPHIKVINQHYQSKMHTLVNALKELLPRCTFSIPQGGMFLYANLPGIDTKKMVSQAMQNGVVFVPGSEFYLEEKITSEMRLNFTHPSHEGLREAVLRLAALQTL